MRAFLTIVAVVLGLLGAELEPAFAQFYGPGPWCAVVNKGMGNMNWDCQYWSVQQCVPNVLAGNRGFAIQTRALSRIIPRPITASVTLARSRALSGPRVICYDRLSSL